METTALTIAGNNMLPVKNMTELREVGKDVMQCGMFSNINEAGGVVIALTCYQLGITLIDFVRTYDMIGGRPAMKADAMASEYRKRGGKYKVISRTPELAKAEFVHDGNSVIFEFSITKAKEAGLTGKDNWKKYPDNMLWARMMSNAVRVMCPEIVAGLYTPEETQDFTEAPTQGRPAPLNPEKVKAKTKPKPAPAETAKPAPIVEDVEIIDDDATPDFGAGVEVDDYTLCPLASSKMYNKPWAVLDLNALKGALTLKNPEMKDGHRAAIAEIIKEKELAGESK